MRQSKTELDVDFIGGQGPLTKSEALAISKFIKANKAKRALLEKRRLKKRTSRRAKRIA
ncbi:MAG: hypothetical protein WDO71_18270 [Bacteroidota bacterium]